MKIKFVIDFCFRKGFFRNILNMWQLFGKRKKYGLNRTNFNYIFVFR